MTAITTAAFDAAMARGELATIQAFLRQPDERAMIAETEARILSLLKDDRADITKMGETLTLQNGDRPWFRRQGELDGDKDVIPLVDVARRGDLDVIEWFFSCENASRMGATLAVLLPLVACFRHGRHPAVRPVDRLVLETLLTSHVFCNLMTDDQKQSVLDMIAGSYTNPTMLEVAITHGARLTTATSVVACYGRDALHSDMSCLVSGDVLLTPSCLWDHVEAEDSFLERRDGKTADRLIQRLISLLSMNQLDAPKRALADGFLDVDARDSDGKTLLMHWASIDADDQCWESGDPSVEITELLLSYGADVTLVDNNGRTALDYARNNDAVAKLLAARLEEPAGDTSNEVRFWWSDVFDWIVDMARGWH